MSSSTNMFKPDMRKNISNVNEDSDTANPIDDIRVTEKWDDMMLPETVLRGVYSYGYEEPSPIQKRAISPMLSGRDMIAQAQSGTGKTATFSIGSMSHIDLEKKKVQIASKILCFFIKIL